MNKTILSLFIKALNVDSSFFYLNKLGYDFTYQEIEILLPYLKNNIDLLDKNKKDYLLNKIPTTISPYCKKQVSKLFDKYIKKEED